MKNIRKKLIVLLFILTTVLLNSSIVFSKSEEPSLVSTAAILVDNKTGKVLYKKNENEKMYPASTTKIMTAILTLEHCGLNDVVTVSYDAMMSIPEGYSSASLQIGEELTVEQLLNLLLVPSANDAANVLAEYVGGSVDSFISMMNTKANELGLSHTHYANTFGLQDENHYTTASDMANLMKYCIKNEDFRKISGKASCAIPSTNKSAPRKYQSTNQLIIPTSSQYYPYLTCGKTGFTSYAGDCLVSCSYKDNFELICVILGGKTVNGVSTRFSETRTLYEYAYNNYSIKRILNPDDIVTNIEVQNGTRDTRNLNLIVNDSLDVLIENDLSENNLTPQINLNDNIKAPIEEGEVLGKIVYNIDGIEYENNLIASHSVEESKLLNFVIWIGLAILILLIIYQIFFKKKKKKYRR